MTTTSAAPAAVPTTAAGPAAELRALLALDADLEAARAAAATPRRG